MRTLDQKRIAFVTGKQVTADQTIPTLIQILKAREVNVAIHAVFTDTLQIATGKEHMMLLLQLLPLTMERSQELRR